MSGLAVSRTVATDFVPESLKHGLEELYLQFRDTVMFRSII